MDLTRKDFCCGTLFCPTGSLLLASRWYSSIDAAPPEARKPWREKYDHKIELRDRFLPQFGLTSALEHCILFSEQ
jgi:hypothetical protein